MFVQRLPQFISYFGFFVVVKPMRCKVKTCSVLERTHFEEGTALDKGHWQGQFQSEHYPSLSVSLSVSLFK